MTKYPSGGVGTCLRQHLIAFKLKLGHYPRLRLIMRSRFLRVDIKEAKSFPRRAFSLRANCALNFSFVLLGTDRRSASQSSMAHCPRSNGASALRQFVNVRRPQA